MITYRASYYIAVPGNPVAGEYRTTGSASAYAALIAILDGAAESTTGADQADTSATITLCRTPTDTTVTDHYTGTLADVLIDLRIDARADCALPYGGTYWQEH